MTLPEWRIPEDGVVDEVAIAIAVSGTRRVRLTLREMRAAARRILASGGDADTLTAHIGMERRNAEYVIAKIRKEDDGEHPANRVERRVRKSASGSGRA